MPLDGTICGIDQHNLRRIESGVVTEDMFPCLQKVGREEYPIREERTKKRGDKAGMRILLIEKRENSGSRKAMRDSEGGGVAAINQTKRERRRGRREVLLLSGEASKERTTAWQGYTTFSPA